MKKNTAIALCLITALLLPCFALAEEDNYLTEEAKSTLMTLDQVDADGFVYHMDYLADYRFDEALATGAVWPDYDAALHELLLPDAPFDPLKGISAGGCSAFAALSPEGHALMGRNYDWTRNANLLLVLHTAPEGGYASVGMCDLGFFGFTKAAGIPRQNRPLLLYAPYVTVDGMNEKGFACTVLVLEEEGMKQERGNTVLPSGFAVRYMLDHAATVEEAIALLGGMDMRSVFYMDGSADHRHGGSFHWLVTDASGDRAVIEYVDGEMKVNRQPLKVSYHPADNTFTLAPAQEDKEYLAVTNFYVSDGIENTRGMGYWRYETLCSLLDENAHPDAGLAMEYMRAVRFLLNDNEVRARMTLKGMDPDDLDHWRWITSWSTVYDTATFTVSLCAEENYDAVYTFSVLDGKADRQ